MLSSVRGGKIAIIGFGSSCGARLSPIDLFIVAMAARNEKIHVILIIEDDATIGPALRRLSARAFPDQVVRLAHNGLAGVEWARQHAADLQLIVLDIGMPLLDGRPVAALLRAIAPSVPIMPFTGDESRLPVMLALGCVTPAIKGKVDLREMPELMRLAMRTPVTALEEDDWVVAMRQSAQTVVTFARDMALGISLAPHPEISLTRGQAEQLVRKLARVNERMPSRELNQTIREIEAELHH